MIGLAPERTSDVRIGAGLEQRLDRRHVVLDRGEDERRETGLGRGVDVRAHLDQPGHDIAVAFGGGPHQRGLTAARLRRVHIGAVPHQLLHGIETARSRRNHHGRLAVPSRRAGVSAGRHQSLDQCRVAVCRRQRHRRFAVFVGGVGIGAGVEQRLRHAAFAEVHRPRQRGRAVGLRRIHVRLGSQQCGERLVVAALDRFEQTDVALLRVQRQQRRPRAETTDGQKQNSTHSVARFVAKHLRTRCRTTLSTAADAEEQPCSSWA